MSTILFLCHDQRGHFGIKKCLSYARSVSWWETQRNDIKTYLKTCHNCQLRKTRLDPRHNAALDLLDVQQPFQLIGIDFTGPFPISSKGNRYLLVIIDFFSRFCQLVPVPDQTTKSASAALLDFVFRFGVPQRILSDKGSAFVSNVFTILSNSLGIEKTTTTSYHPQCNGRTERLNRVVHDSIDPSSSLDFEQQCASIQFAINTSVHRAHGVTPYEIIFNRPARTTLSNLSLSAYSSINLDEIRSKIAVYEQKYAKQFDQKQRNISFQAGDLVLKRTFHLTASTKKFSSPFRGPYRVMKTYPDRPNIYKIQLVVSAGSPLCNVKPEIVNVARLQRYFSRQSYPRFMTSFYSTGPGSDHTSHHHEVSSSSPLLTSPSIDAKHDSSPPTPTHTPDKKTTGRVSTLDGLRVVDSPTENPETCCTRNS